MTDVTDVTDTKRNRRKKTIVIFTIMLATLAAWQFGPRTPAAWTDAQLVTLRSLTLTNLAQLPADHSNTVADDPRAAKLGHRLFFDARLSANGAVSCATCHQPARRFTDGLVKGRAIGQSGRNTPSIVGTAYSPWLYWDGRRDSQWAQALSPLEDAAEHGGNRMAYVRFVASDALYRAGYETLFAALPDFSDEKRFPLSASPVGDPVARMNWITMSDADRHQVNTVFANIGKTIAAYERLLLPGRSRFDDYVDSLAADGKSTAKNILTNDEILGLQVFIGDGRCTECHNGPLLTNNEFHNTGVLSAPGELPERGRINGLKQVLADPFNCGGAYNDDPQASCPELTYVRSGIELIGTTRTPSLRNLGGTAPYSHKGQQATLTEVIDLYNRSPLAMIGHNEAEEKLNLSWRAQRQLEAFLQVLDAPLATADEWLKAP